MPCSLTASAPWADWHLIDVRVACRPRRRQGAPVLSELQKKTVKAEPVLSPFQTNENNIFRSLRPFTGSMHAKNVSVHVILAASADTSRAPSPVEPPRYTALPAMHTSPTCLRRTHAQMDQAGPLAVVAAASVVASVGAARVLVAASATASAPLPVRGCSLPLALSVSAGVNGALMVWALPPP